MATYEPQFYDWSSSTTEATITPATGVYLPDTNSIDFNLDALLSQDDAIYNYQSLEQQKLTATPQLISLPTQQCTGLKKTRTCKNCQSLQKSLSGLREGYQILYEEKAKLETNILKLNKEMEGYHNTMSTQKILIDQLVARNEQLSHIDNLRKESIMKEVERLRRFRRRKPKTRHLKIVYRKKSFTEDDECRGVDESWFDNELDIPSDSSSAIEDTVTPVEDTATTVEDISLATPVEDTAIPVEDVPVSTPVEDISVATPVEDVPVSTPVEDISVATPVEDIPVAIPVEDVPVSTPVEDISVATPVEDVPVSTPVEDIPVAIPVEDVPVSTPVEDISVATPVEDVPVSTPVEDIPVSIPVEDISVATPVEDIPVSIPVEDVSLTTPVEDIPVSIPVEDISVATPVEDIPVSIPVEDISVATPVEDIPVSIPVEDISVATPVEDIPVSTPVEDISVATPVEDIPVSTPVEDIPVATPVEDIPVYTPVEDISVTKSMLVMSRFDICRKRPNNETDICSKRTCYEQNQLPTHENLLLNDLELSSSSSDNSDMFEEVIGSHSVVIGSRSVVIGSRSVVIGSRSDAIPVDNVVSHSDHSEGEILDSEDEIISFANVNNDTTFSNSRVTECANDRDTAIETYLSNCEENEFSFKLSDLCIPPALSPICMTPPNSPIPSIDSLYLPSLSPIPLSPSHITLTADEPQNISSVPVDTDSHPVDSVLPFCDFISDCTIPKSCDIKITSSCSCLSVTTPVTNELSVVSDSDSELVIDSNIDYNYETQATPTWIQPSTLDDQSAVDVLAVGYGDSTVSNHVIISEDKNKSVQMVSNKDGATGQLMKEEATLSNVTPFVNSTHSKLSSEFSQAQRELPHHLTCVHYIPPWLAQSMLSYHLVPNQFMPRTDNAKDNLHMKLKNPTVPIMRTGKKHRVSAYVFTTLKYLLCGSLYLSTAIAMFSSATNVTSHSGFVAGVIRFLKCYYQPQFDCVKKMSWEKCAGVLSKTLDPFSQYYTPPLLTMESMLIALLYNVNQLNPKLKTPALFKELMTSLRNIILSDGTNFHIVCSLCRIYTALCRLFQDFNQIQFLSCELLLKSCQSTQTTHYLPLLVAIATIWPRCLSRTTNKPLVVNRKLHREGLNIQPLSFTVEVSITELIERLDPNNEHQYKKLMRSASILCKWSQLHQSIINDLVPCLIDILKNSKDVNLSQSPYLSTHGEAIVISLRVIAAVRGWEWTRTILVGDYIWPLLQLWNKGPDNLREATIVGIIKLLGYIGEQGLQHQKKATYTTVQEKQSTVISLQKLQDVLLIRLQQCNNSSKKVTFSIQLATVDSLLCLYRHSNDTKIFSNINQWLGPLFKRPDTVRIADDYYKKLMKLK